MDKKKIKILLVDDEPDILEFISYNLSNEGYKVYTAVNGEEAIEKAKSKSPNLILLDVMMPIMDGIEACENLRKIPKLGEKLIIVFLTARSEDTHRLLVWKLVQMTTSQNQWKLKFSSQKLNHYYVVLVMGKKALK